MVAGGQVGQVGGSGGTGWGNGLTKRLVEFEGS